MIVFKADLSLRLHEVGSRLQSPHDLSLLGAVHAAILRVPHVGHARLINVVQADPVGGIDFLLDVPGDDQVAVA